MTKDKEDKKKKIISIGPTIVFLRYGLSNSEPHDIRYDVDFRNIY